MLRDTFVGNETVDMLGISSFKSFEKRLFMVLWSITTLNYKAYFIDALLKLGKHNQV